MGTREKRGMLGHYAVAFALLGLIVAGVFLYEPLKLEYAIYRVHRTEYPGLADKWLMCLTNAACRGNRRAMETAVDYGYVIPAGPGCNTATPIFSLLLTAQPELYFDVLSGREDMDVLAILTGSADARLGGRGISPSDKGLMVSLHEDTFHTWAQSDKPWVARAGRQGLEFLRRRFAKELDTAKQPAPPSP
ncbi:MAG TPA: hypothetical protein PK280_19305 [Planctomycetota bacterium]|nr:hypothetical protein [Planctomycetota bacterium]